MFDSNKPRGLIMRSAALQALISSLSPNGSEENKLNEEQIEALSERLDQFLGTVNEGPEVRRNEKGEVRQC